MLALASYLSESDLKYCSSEVGWVWVTSLVLWTEMEWYGWVDSRV